MEPAQAEYACQTVKADVRYALKQLRLALTTNFANNTPTGACISRAIDALVRAHVALNAVPETHHDAD